VDLNKVEKVGRSLLWIISLISVASSDNIASSLLILDDMLVTGFSLFSCPDRFIKKYQTIKLDKKKKREKNKSK
jgi:hypothetical protein